MRIQPTPVASVVIPAHNAVATIGKQLRALAAQVDVGPLEVIVVDNRSTDGTAEEALHHRAALPLLRVITAADRPGPSYARNVGIEAACTDRILLCDADDEVTPRWASALLDALARGKAVCGRSVGAGERGELLDDDEPFVPRLGFLHGFGAGNAAFDRSAFLAVGGFDEGLPTTEDLELAWRLQLAGYALLREDRAVVKIGYRTTNADLFRQSFHHGRGSVMVYEQYAPLGMPRSSPTVALKAWVLLTLRSVEFWAPRERRSFWYRRLGMRSGRLVESARRRVLYL